jgi:hypothetical protein
MLDVTEVYRIDPHDFEPRPFQDRVLELVRLFHEDPVVRLRILGTIGAGAPIEALPGSGDTVEVRGPLHSARRHRALLRRYLCPALERASGDAFEIARVITPLLAGLKVSGQVQIDLDPWLCAGISLLIARTGVAAFCSEDEEDVGDADAATESGAAVRPVKAAATLKGATAQEGRRRHRASGSRAT